MLEFSMCLENIKNTTKRKEKFNFLINYLKLLNNTDRLIVCKILLNEYITYVGPKSLQNEFNNQTTFNYHKTELIDLWNAICEMTHSRTSNQGIINSLMIGADKLSKKYIKMVLLNNINIGISDNTILDAIEEAYNIHNTKYNYYLVNNIEMILNGHTGIELFKPIRPMLAKPLKDEIPLQFIANEKLDGYRCMLHYTKDKWMMFSRDLNDISSNDIYNNIVKCIPDNVDSLILDGEIISKTFQESRKKDSEKKFVIFDILYYNGESLINKRYIDRVAYLNRFDKLEKVKLFSNVDDDKVDIIDFYKSCVENNYEGIVVKDINSYYQPHERGWFKIKKSTDTLDLAIVGAEYGEVGGSREGLYGSLILGIMFNNEITPICKVGSGFTDEDLKMFYNLLKDDVIYTNNNLVYFNPKYVVEVEYFEMTDSSIYDCGKSLRFPIYKKFRDDKKISEINKL